jgi:hypothetical protein
VNLVVWIGDHVVGSPPITARFIALGAWQINSNSFRADVGKLKSLKLHIAAVVKYYYLYRLCGFW